LRTKEAGGASIFLPSLERGLLISGSVEDVQNICDTAAPSIIDEIFSDRKAFNASSDPIGRSARIGEFGEQAKPIDDVIDYAVRYRLTCALGPILKDFFEISFREI
jgi:hypothetical protein